MRGIRNNKEGFSLVELLVSMVISGIVMAIVYSVYTGGQKVFRSQQQIVEVQQVLRAGMLLLANDIRMSGYDPTGDASAGIVNLGADTITITMDLDDDDAFNSPGEYVTYSLATLADGRQNLYRTTAPPTIPLTPPVPNEAVAENIDALNFVYLDRDGNVTASADAVRSIQLTMVARSSSESNGLTDNTTYRNLQGASLYAAGGDSFRRRQLTAQIKCRNLGL